MAHLMMIQIIDYESYDWWYIRCHFTDVSDNTLMMSWMTDCELNGTLTVSQMML